MGKYFKQAGHYRTYKQTGKQVTINGGPGGGVGIGAIIVGLVVFGMTTCINKVFGPTEQDKQRIQEQLKQREQEQKQKWNRIKAREHELYEQGVPYSECFSKAWKELYPNDLTNK